ncbi:MAG: RidA family protein [Melioribacteraceae bacterium]|nr:RidA family protein [Melioribacteraceae bacterium]MCF8353878.1 RidA family protein [Melioribacteraceae bacterium]MCF8393111.1 RidA family protein [Melioribacteraceae bacterium]
MKIKIIPIQQSSLFILVFTFITFSSILAQKEIIKTENAPEAIGPYSQAVKIGNMLYASGQIPLDPETGKIVEGGIVEQTRRVFDNIKAVLIEAGFELSDVVQCQIFLSDLNNYAEMNKIYAEYFQKDFPARAVVEVSRIPRDSMLEAMVIAQK